MIETGRFDEAIELLERSEGLIMTHHEMGQWSNNMGIALYKKGKIDEGLKYLEKSVKYAPEESIFLMNLGGMYGSIRDYENAARVFKKALHLSPSSIEIKLSLAKTYLNCKDYDQFFSTMDTISESGKSRRDDIRDLMKKAKEMQKNRKDIIE